MILWYQEKPKQGPASYLPAYAVMLATEVLTNRSPTWCGWGSQWNFMDITDITWNKHEINMVLWCFMTPKLGCKPTRSGRGQHGPQRTVPTVRWKRSTSDLLSVRPMKCARKETPKSWKDPILNCVCIQYFSGRDSFSLFFSAEARMHRLVVNASAAALLQQHGIRWQTI